MKAKSVSSERLMILLVVVPIIYLAITWNQLPAKITTHYDLQGRPDGWMPKENAAFIVSSLSILLYLLLRFLPAVDPKRQIQTSNYQKLRFMVVLFQSAVTSWLFYTAANPAQNQGGMTIILALVGLLLAGIGNYMTTIKPNWFVGIRTPWTLKSDDVWRKTHRMGGRLMVAGGLLSAILAFAVPMPYTLSVVVGVVLLTAFISVGYSYIYFLQEKNQQLN